jgi:YYY domain-containing protein
MTQKDKHPWFYDLLLIAVLLTGAYFRTLGLNWDENQHLHPDERFLTMVETGIAPVGTPQEQLGPPPTIQTQEWRQEYADVMPDCVEWGGYFDTYCSPLNPDNRGYTFYVYGDLPIVTVRYTAEAMTTVSQWAGQKLEDETPSGLWGQVLTELARVPSWTGYDEVPLVGRQLSTLSDLGSIILLYFIAARIYNRKVGVLAAAFSSLAVLQIQQSHFFTVDTFANFFIFLAVYFAVKIATQPLKIASAEETETEHAQDDTLSIVSIFRNPLFLNSLGFGLALGMSVACKINAAPLAVLLPGAFAVSLFRDGNPFKGKTPAETERLMAFIAVFLVTGALASLLAFRVFQPYAFRGPGFFNILPNPHWIDTIAEQRGQASGDIDVPFALQWARRSHLFSFENLTEWGLGLPLGILAWVGVLVMGWRIFKGEWRQHSLLWGWTVLYFLWQSTQSNPTMRYQLPIYPLLAMMAAWATVEGHRSKVAKRTFNLRPVTWILGGIVLILTFAYAFAFTRIYTRPHTRVSAARWIYQNVPGPVGLPILSENGLTLQPVPYPGYPILPGAPVTIGANANASGTLTEILLNRVTDMQPAGAQTLTVSILVSGEMVAQASLSADFSAASGPFNLVLDRPVQMAKGVYYELLFETTGGTLSFSGAVVANESSWDDGQPLRMDGYDGFGGIYTGLNLELYWDDNPDKLQRFYDILDQADYIFITSNRQWATITRVPERYPLTTVYYRALIGCPPEQDVITCYNVARPGDYQGELGFELVKVFESFPTFDIPGLLHWEANTQFAEEAFTVYDATKVLIFKKADGYSRAQVENILGKVDLSNVVHLTPRRAADYKDLMLPADKLAQQQAGGTWSDLFDTSALINRYPALGLLWWYFFTFILGLLTYPLVRLIFPGLKDRGYPLARAAGLVILAYFSWLAGSVGLTYSRTTIGVVLALLAAAGLGSGWMQREELLAEWKSKKRYFLLVEGVFLSFFLFDLLIRLGNPDLWHPAKGGERPMDFSYFNAVVKSTSFPPYDPWFAGGYINYYYYGFVLVGTPVKLLGIVPAIAYNFLLPTIFAIVATGAFSIGFNLVEGGRSQVAGEQPSTFSLQLVTGVAASAAVVLLGNLGTMQLIYQALQKAGAPNGVIDAASISQRWAWAFSGLVKVMTGAPLPVNQGEWYWNPSRVMPYGPGNEITEFPYFTFLYSDLHAHMLVLLLTTLTIAWAVSVIKAQGKWKNGLSVVLSFGFAGLVVGAIKPTNTWDYYTYLPLAAIAAGYAVWRGGEGHGALHRLILAAGSMVLLAGLSKVFYQPYDHWYGLGYNQVNRWMGPYTPIWSYFTHWGLFLFIITAWMSWETREWMANTPLSSLQKLRPYRFLIEVFASAVIVMLIALAAFGVKIGWIALPLAVWGLVLILRPSQPDAKRLVLFMVGTGMLLTIVVELVVLVGDIGRMNTIFKLYLQAWSLLAVSAAAGLGWLLPDLRRWTPGWRSFFEGTGILLLAIAALFTLTATFDKIRDRMAPAAPHSLDSMVYMQYAQYWDHGDMDLSQDYAAIRWMQENIQGSPVIVEANSQYEYLWGKRYTIYTGLPGVVGWNWHQRQQRGGVVPAEWVENRIQEINTFYDSINLLETRAFLEKYNARYIIVGQLERNYYTPEGLAKFEQYNNHYWKEIYRDRATVIYEVLP